MLIRDLPRSWGFRIGNLWIPPASTGEVMMSYVRPLLLVDPSAPDFPALRGSVTLVKIGSETFAVCTKHQFVSGETSLSDAVGNLCVSRLEDQLTSIEITNVRSSSSSGYEHDDLCIISTKPENTAKDKASYLAITNPRNSTLPVISSRFYGYGQAYGEVIYEPNLHVKLGPIGGKCECVGEWSGQPYGRIFKSDIPLDLDYNGMSGGAIYHLRSDGTDSEVTLDAIVVRGGSGSIYGVGVEFIFDALENG